MTGDQTPQPECVLPLHAEELSVGKQIRETGTVRVSTHTVSVDETVRQWLAQEKAEVERVPIGTYVTSHPEVREEGDTLIVPVVEEVLVVQRHLLLKEEIHVRRVRTTRLHEQTITLRHEEAVIERDSAPAAPDKA